jgi:tetratricopeptide (TPR) repeat protein
MKKKRNLYNNILFLLFLGIFLLGELSLFADKEDAIAVKEMNLQDSFKAVINENRKLKNEIKEVKDSNDKLNFQLNLYIQRIKKMIEQIQILQKNLSAARNTSKERLNKISELKQNLKKIAKDKTAPKISAAEKSIDKIAIVKQENQRLREKNGRLYYNLGNKLFREKNYQEAANQYNKALSYLPFDPDVYYNLAVIYDYYHKNPKKAIAYYSKYLKNKSNPKNTLLVKERIVQNQLEAKLNEDKDNPF